MGFEAVSCLDGKREDRSQLLKLRTLRMMVLVEGLGGNAQRLK